MSALKNISVRSSGSEKYRVPIIARLDPSLAVPVFNVTATTATDPDVTWLDGAWENSYDPATGRINGLTPTIGKSGSGIEVTEGITYLLWVKWVHDGEEIVRPVATMEAV